MSASSTEYSTRRQPNSPAAAWNRHKCRSSSPEPSSRFSGETRRTARKCSHDPIRPELCALASDGKAPYTTGWCGRIHDRGRNCTSTQHWYRWRWGGRGRGQESWPVPATVARCWVTMRTYARSREPTTASSARSLWEQPLLRHSLSILVNGSRDLATVAQAGTGNDAVQLAHETAPDVIPHEHPHARWRWHRRNPLHHRRPHARRHQGAHAQHVYVYGTLRAGASGFHLKDAHPDQLLDSLLAPRPSPGSSSTTSTGQPQPRHGVQRRSLSGSRRCSPSSVADCPTTRSLVP